MDEQIDILERIHAAYFQLTTTERKVADYVLSQPGQVQFMSITQLADECGTAEASISRFCRTLKLKGFNAFKIELARHCAGTAAKPLTQEPETVTGCAAQVARSAADAVSQTVELIEPEKTMQVVSLIEQAPRVICMGSGGSMIMADECAHLFSTVSQKFYSVADSHLQMSCVATLEPGSVVMFFSYSGATRTGLQILDFAKSSQKFYSVADSHLQMSCVATLEPGSVVMFFSYSGATRTGLQILDFAKSRGIHTVLVTRFYKSPAAKLAEVVLRCGSTEGPFQFGSVPARIAQLVVLDVLFQEYYQRNKSPAAKLAEVVLRCGSTEGPFQFGSVPARIAQLVVLDVLFQEYYQRNRVQCQESVQAIASALSDMHV